MKYLLINSDKKSLHVSPHHIWMANSAAYTSHGQKIFGRLTVGDILFMYENQEGITAIGKVKEIWDGINLGYLSDEVYKNETLIYQLKVNWFIKLKKNPITTSEIKDFGYSGLFNRTDIGLSEEVGDAILELAKAKNNTNVEMT